MWTNAIRCLVIALACAQSGSAFPNGGMLSPRSRNIRNSKRFTLSPVTELDTSAETTGSSYISRNVSKPGLDLPPIPSHPIVRSEAGTTVTFQLYGDIGEERALSTCQANAFWESLEQITHLGLNSPMGVNTRTWRSDPAPPGEASAVLGLIPDGRLTWSMWSRATLLMGDIAILYQRGFSYSIKDDSTGDAELGSGLMKVSQGESVTMNDTISKLNSSVPIVQTNSSMNTSLRALPEPYIVRDGTTTITFYGYGKAIDDLIMESVLYQVVESFELMPFNRPMGTKVREYTAKQPPAVVSLVLIPGARLVWGMLRKVFKGTEEIESEGWREFSFDIVDTTVSEAPIGWGFLKASTVGGLGEVASSETR